MLHFRVLLKAFDALQRTVVVFDPLYIPHNVASIQGGSWLIDINIPTKGSMNLPLIQPIPSRC